MNMKNMGCSNKNSTMLMVVMVVVVVLAYGGKWAAEAHVHHVVGDDRGWELASDIASWATGRTFVVGDFLWFAYESGKDKDNVVELKSKQEFESCDVSNPIMKYTNGIDKVSLEKEGIRYFASANIQNCKKGLKLPVEIKPKSTVVIESPPAPFSSWKMSSLAEEPSVTPPSSSTMIICRPIIMMIIMGGVAIFFLSI